MCDHKRLKTVNCRLFCLECGAELPLEFLTGEKKKDPTKRRPAKKNSEKGQEHGR